MEEYFMTVKQDNRFDKGCFADGYDIKVGDIFALEAVEVGINDKEMKEIRFKLDKVKMAKNTKLIT